MMRFMLLFSRQGKLRLQKWYTAAAERDRKKMVRELMQVVLARKPKMCSFLEWRDLKIVYKRYASLYFCCAVEEQDNELVTLEVIHRFVELLDKYFGSMSSSWVVRSRTPPRRVFLRPLSKQTCCRRRMNLQGVFWRRWVWLKRLLWDFG
ncbi:AP-1 complex subunit sigma-1A isoform X2 [Scleropages formosus]|uniref:AP-1 complex subunit sigma-1A isoform X2 n=1 Tax=Scleropages formosus TaxID=113540 RepID=UPI000878F03B|nr:AP-1 complex subunit sigma-1A isoform X2 [Scleropages formosus]XP_029107088.1 AP-1 complex subunit sigma-1A isoform X2 [Scleropages formosus]